jgi:TonB family protein
MKFTLPLLSLSLLSAASVNICLAETSQHLTTIIDAKATLRVNPTYPKMMAMKGIEGWAKVSYIVETDGSVSNVIITDSSGYKSFEKETVKALKSWKFTPAQENGKAIQQCHNNIQMDFMLSDKDGGVSRKFLRKYRRAEEALAAKDFKGTKEELIELENYKQRRLSEQVYTKLLQADYAKAVDNKTLQLSALDSIGLTSKIISPEQELSILQQKFILKVQLNHYKSALATYKKLEKLDLAKPYMPHFSKIEKKIIDMVESDNKIVVQGDIKEKDFWYHSLVRNDFSLMNIKGSLHKLDVRCANKRHVYSVEEKNTWKIPASWQGCSLYIYGENNTKFTLVEHPSKIETTAAIN